MKKILSFLALTTLVVCCATLESKAHESILPDKEHLLRKFDSKDRKLFVSPSKKHYPQTFFHFIGGNVSYEGITADLEALAEAGVSGIEFFHGRAYGGKWPATGEDIEVLSDKWEEALKFLIDECKRLDIRFSINNCPGWATSGGPWIKPENAMRLLVQSSQIVKGGQKVSTTLAQPNNQEWQDYRDIAVLAFPTPEGAANPCPQPASISGSGDVDWQKPILHNKGFWLSPIKNGANWVEVSYNEPTIIRTLQFSPVRDFHYNLCYDPEVVVKMYAYNAKGESTKVIDAPLPPSNWQDVSTMSIACPVVEDAVKYRIEIENQHYAYIYRLNLLSQALKNSWESEASWTLRGLERTADDVVQPSDAYLKYDQIVDVSQYLSADGRFEWTPPTNDDWTIMRLGHINAGQKNTPAPPAATGWECDKLSTEGPEAHFAGYVGRLASTFNDKAFNGMVVDSWECETQTWTIKMEEEFKSVSGYELRKWLPAVMGYVVDDPQTTSRFLLDWRRTVGELFTNKFYRRMAELAHEAGLTVIYETAAGDIFPADIMEYFKHADIPMCEFWQPFSFGYVGDINFKPIMPTASAARLYGKSRVAAESFTSFSLTWNEHFDALKEIADYHFVEGVTHNTLHTYTHNPQIDFKQPGTSFGRDIGTPFLRGQTWWKHMKELTSYLARCSYMLERGQSTSDVLWYLGDEIGHKPDQKDPFPAGYKFDYCNPDVLLSRLSVEDGMITTPEGLRYRMMWIPDNKRMLPETLEKLQQLILDGAVVVANAPKSVATLRDCESSERRFDAAVKAIWGNAQAGQVVAVGKGKILSGVSSIDEAIEILGLKADVVGDVRWLHRRTEGADWYFVTPQKQTSFVGKVKFHATGRVELWNPATSEIIPIASTTDGEYTTIDLDIPRYNSCFVVFEKGKKPHKVQPTTPPTKTIALNNKWTIEFPDGWGAPTKITTSELKPWQELIENEEGRSFSGTATYTTTFNLGDVKRGEPIVLDLGQVDMIAVVKVNGKKVRTLWFAPYCVDISNYIHQGENTLSVEVTSTWYNRLVYDAALPEAERKTWMIHGPKADAAYNPTGLLGEVCIRY